MSESTVLLELDAQGVATVTLNRPQVRNAFDDALIAELTAVWTRLDDDPAVRAVVVTGAGSAFSAGGDLHWMRRMAGYGEVENVADAMRLAQMFRALNTLRRPTIARVNGAAIAGGVGLVCCSDIAIASSAAVFSIAEVRLGLAPSTISPYVVAAIGARAARRLFVTAETISAAEALRIGMVHEVAEPQALDAAVKRVVDAVLAGGPEAQARCKRLIAEVADRPVTEAVMGLTARSIAGARASAEGQEGLAAFFEKRKPRWRP